MFLRKAALISLLGVGLLASPGHAQSLDALEQLLEEHPTAGLEDSAEVPRWIDVSITAPAPPALGVPFEVEARVTSLLARLPAARFEWILPEAVSLTEGPSGGKLSLEKGKARTLLWKLVVREPLNIVEGQLELSLSARPPKRALFKVTRKMPPDQAARVEAEIRKLGREPTRVVTRLEVAVDGREGFAGFSPLVWSSYLDEDGFYIGAGSFMDANFEAQDLVADAERLIVARRFDQALALLDQARVELRPDLEADPLLRWEAANNEAICEFETGKTSEAIAVWKRIARDPRFRHVKRYCLYNLGEAHRRLGRTAQAIDYFESAARDKPAFQLPARKLMQLKQAPARRQGH